MPKSEPPSPAQADPIAHNPKLVTTPAKRAIAEDLIHVRMAYFPIFEPQIQRSGCDPRPNKTSFVANCNDLFMVNNGTLIVND
jgi:hypothetical protein